MEQNCIKSKIKEYAILMMDKLQKSILSMFIDSSNRPKKTPIHESAIQVRLEDNHLLWKVSYSLEKLENLGILNSVTHEIPNSKKAKFYFATKLLKISNKNEIEKKIRSSAYWINRYSDPKITSMLGEHLRNLVVSELRAHGFKIKEGKDLRTYRKKNWEKSKEGLDIIAKNSAKKLAIGVEVKNMLYLPPKKEIESKIKMCETLGLTPIFACRWIKPYKKEISAKGGFAWQFKYQLYPLGQKPFVEIIRKRFQLPLQVRGELPKNAVKKLELWLKSY